MRIQKTLGKLSKVDNNSKLLLEDIKSIVSKRQYKVVKFKESGYKNIEIASKLGVCPATITNDIKKIRKQIKEKLLK